MVLKGTNVDGVYDSDPRSNPEARLLSDLSLREVTVQDLRVMDITAVTLCAENKIPGETLRLHTFLPYNTVQYVLYCTLHMYCRTLAAALLQGSKHALTLSVVLTLRRTPALCFVIDCCSGRI